MGVLQDVGYLLGGHAPAASGMEIDWRCRRTDTLEVDITWSSQVLAFLVTTCIESFDYFKDLSHNKPPYICRVTNCSKRLAQCFFLVGKYSDLKYSDLKHSDLNKHPFTACKACDR